jgi:hypothetical protein
MLQRLVRVTGENYVWYYKSRLGGQQRSRSGNNLNRKVIRTLQRVASISDLSVANESISGTYETADRPYCRSAKKEASGSLHSLSAFLVLIPMPHAVTYCP